MVIEGDCQYIRKCKEVLFNKHDLSYDAIEIFCSKPLKELNNVSISNYVIHQRSQGKSESEIWGVILNVINFLSREDVLLLSTLIKSSGVQHVSD